MHRVEIKSTDTTVATRTSNHQALVDRTLDGWAKRGLWVQMPLPDCGPVVYRAFRNGVEVVRMTVREVEDEA